MRFIYLSILAITLSFTMNTYAEKSNPYIVNMYWMYETEDSTEAFRVLCVEGLMFLTPHMNAQKVFKDEWHVRSALVQMYGENNKPMTCPKLSPLQ